MSTKDTVRFVFCIGLLLIGAERYAYKRWWKDEFDAAAAEALAYLRPDIFKRPPYPDKLDRNAESGTRKRAGDALDA